MAKRRAASRAGAGTEPSQVPPLGAEGPIEGVPGLGRWLVFTFEPTSLFSLKVSSATSGVGRTLVVPTPYAIKMALVDAALRTGWQGNPDELIGALARAELRVSPPERAVITSTIVRVRQGKKSGGGYTSSVAFREFVSFGGSLRWAFDLNSLSTSAADSIVELAPRVYYLGKRGGFVQFLGVHREHELPDGYCQPLGPGLKMPNAFHVAVLDDFGPEANFNALNSYSTSPIQRGKHRIFTEMVVPLESVAVGPGFVDYRAGG